MFASRARCAPAQLILRSCILNPKQQNPARRAGQTCEALGNSEGWLVSRVTRGRHSQPPAGRRRRRRQPAGAVQQPAGAASWTAAASSGRRRRGRQAVAARLARGRRRRRGDRAAGRQPRPTAGALLPCSPSWPGCTCPVAVCPQHHARGSRRSSGWPTRSSSCMHHLLRPRPAAICMGSRLAPGWYPLLLMFCICKTSQLSSCCNLCRQQASMERGGMAIGPRGPPPPGQGPGRGGRGAGPQAEWNGRVGSAEQRGGFMQRATSASASKTPADRCAFAPWPMQRTTCQYLADSKTMCCGFETGPACATTMPCMYTPPYGAFCYP